MIQRMLVEVPYSGVFEKGQRYKKSNNPEVMCPLVQ